MVKYYSIWPDIYIYIVFYFISCVHGSMSSHSLVVFGVPSAMFRLVFSALVESFQDETSPAEAIALFFLPATLTIAQDYEEN